MVDDCDGMGGKDKAHYSDAGSGAIPYVREVFEWRERSFRDSESYWVTNGYALQLVDRKRISMVKSRYPEAGGDYVMGKPLTADNRLILESYDLSR